MSAPMNRPPYESEPEEPMPTPENPTWSQSGTYEIPSYKNLSSGVAAAPGIAFTPPRNQLSEEDYRTNAYASSADVDRHINTDEVHEPFYGELGPRAYPA